MRTQMGLVEGRRGPHTKGVLVQDILTFLFKNLSNRGMRLKNI